MNEVWVQPQVRPLIKNKKPTRQKTKQVGDWDTGIEDTVHVSPAYKHINI